MKKYEELTEQERCRIIGFQIPDGIPIFEMDKDADRVEVIMQIIEAMTEFRPLSKMLDETVEVCGYEPLAVDRDYLRSLDILDRLLERMDEEYKHEDDDWSQETTRGMVEAENEFFDKMIAEYTVTKLEAVCSDNIHIGEFVKEHCAHWLNEADEEG